MQVLSHKTPSAVTKGVVHLKFSQMKRILRKLALLLFQLLGFSDISLFINRKFKHATFFLVLLMLMTFEQIP